jgi:hypothetical protein
MDRMLTALLTLAALSACPGCSERPADAHLIRRPHNESRDANNTQQQATRLENCVTSVGADRTRCVAR